MTKKTKKKTTKKVKKTTKIKKPNKVKWSDFYEWWEKVAGAKVSKIEKRWCKDNEPNDPEEDAGGDHWHVNQMMHDGCASETTAEIASEIFEKGRKGEPWEFAQEYSLYCELDDVIVQAYEAGRLSKK